MKTVVPQARMKEGRRTLQVLNGWVFLLFCFKRMTETLLHLRARDGAERAVVP